MSGDRHEHTTTIEEDARRLLRSPLARALLSVVPEERRDAFEGDLSERLQRDVLRLEGLARARRWLHRELFRSMPAMLRQRATGGGRTARGRWLVALVTALLGALQAWDAGALRSAPSSIVVLIAIAVATPPIALGMSVGRRGMLVAIGVTVVLAAAARLCSSVPLPGLGLIVVPASVFFFVWTARRPAGRRIAG